VIYVYAICETGRGVPNGCEGLDGAPVTLLEREQVCAVHSVHSVLDLRAELGTLWRHERVVQRLMEQGPVLPTRFGTTFQDERGLDHALADAAPRLALALERVRGCVELAVRVGRPSEPDDPPGDGRDYLMGKLRRARERDSLAERMLAPLDRIAADARRRDPSPDAATITASYLVPEDQVLRFAEEVRTLQRQNDGIEMSCTGPWAPYSFAEEAT
jgi:hypothetical protein